MRSLLQSVISALLAADADVVVGAELGERPSASRRPLDFVDEKLPAVLEHLVRLRTDLLSFHRFASRRLSRAGCHDPPASGPDLVQQPSKRLNDETQRRTQHSRDRPQS